MSLKDYIDDVIVSDIVKPILVNWEHGGVLSDDPSGIHCEILTKKDKPGTIVPVVSTKQYGNVYVGEKEPYSDLCHNFLVVRNKATRKLKLYAADKYFMSLYRHDEKPGLTGIKQTVQPSNRDAMMNLNKTFASRKIRRRTNEAANLNLKSDNIMEQIKSSEVTENDEADSPPSQVSYLPPCNRSALSIQQAYRLYSMVTPDELDSLHSFADKMLNNDPSKPSSRKFSRFLNYTIPQIKLLDIQKLEILIVIDALMTFLNFPAWKLHNKEPDLCHYSSLLNKKLLDQFCVPSSTGRCRPAYMRDKALSYILVLYFIVNDYELDTKIFLNCITVMDCKRLPLLLRAIGAKQSTSSLTKYTLQLPLNPLPLPKPVKRKRN